MVSGTLTTPLYRPAVINILSITNSNPAIITTTYDGIIPAPNGYIDGLRVRILIPTNFGMSILNKASGVITVIDPNSFEIDIDTSNLDPFVIPPPVFLPPPYPPWQPAAQINPFSEIAEITRGSFTNVFQQPKER